MAQECELASAFKILNNYIHDNGQMGIGGGIGTVSRVTSAH